MIGIHENGELKPLANGYTLGNGGGSGTSVPTADTLAKFDSDAHMNSGDMTSQEVDDFVDGLNVSGINAVDYIVEQGTSGIWTYTKWNNGSYEAVYVGNVNMQAGSAMGGGYFHQTSSALTPPSFSQTVKSLHGSANGAVLFSYVGHANDYSTYWWNASSTAVSNVPVRLEMNGTWK